MSKNVSSLSFEAEHNDSPLGEKEPKTRIQSSPTVNFFAARLSMSKVHTWCLSLPPGSIESARLMPVGEKTAEETRSLKSVNWSIRLVARSRIHACGTPVMSLMNETC